MSSHPPNDRADPLQPAVAHDTRGYLLRLLGRHHEAIDQLRLAIPATEERRRDLATRARRKASAARQLRDLDHGLAVMPHQRGLARRAAGLARQAEQDFEITERKGYDPSRGMAVDFPVRCEDP